VNGNPVEMQRTRSGRRRRWLLALDPIIEGGRHGKRAQAWDVEDELIAVALLGDVTIDLSQVKSAPAEIDIDAYAILRDVDVLVAEGTHVEMSGGVLRGDLRNAVPVVPEEQRCNVIRIHGHTLLGDVTARIAAEHPHAR
jgi:metallophosphoesterase superfamily enzyme